MLITLDSVSKKNNLKVILDQVSFTIEENQKIALIGVNGCGKTTLMKILAGSEHIDSGKIIKKNGLRIAYLSQDPFFEEGKSCLYQVLSLDKEIKEFEAKAILNRLGIDDVNQNISLLSGGMRKRVALAQALLKPCDLLLLDEPTNHLDSDMVEWLETYLKKYNKAIFMVTHDRYFMERICNVMIEMFRGHLTCYEANYSKYLELKAEREQIELSRMHKRKQILKKELAWMRAGVQARTTKAKDRIKRFYELSAVEDYKVDSNMKLDTLTTRLGKKVLEAHNLSKSYDKLLFSNFNYHLQRNDRIGILGKNGCGKTTLLKILANQISSDTGYVEYGETLKLGYFKQGSEDMDPSMRVIDYIKNESNEIETLEGSFSASQMLERFLFDSKAQYQVIGSLSGGEQRRLYLLKVLMSAPNVLFLDEPTNDLDITTLSILEDYLDDFNGAIITVSHDRYFLDRICDKLFVFENSQINEILGGYSYYLELNQNKIKEKEEIKTVKRYQVIKMSTKEKQELEMMEKVIEDLSMEVLSIEEAMNQESDYQKINELSIQRDELEALIEAKMLRWEELSEKKKLIDEQLNG